MNDVPLSERDLDALVEEWLDWSQTAALLGVTPGKVRTMIKQHELAAAVPATGGGPKVPADFIQDGLVVKGLPGLLTVLHDRNFDDRECIAWLFTDDELPGRPIDALRENRGREAKVAPELRRCLPEDLSAWARPCGRLRFKVSPFRARSQPASDSHKQAQANTKGDAELPQRKVSHLMN